MEYVSDEYQQTLDNLAESLRAARREKLEAELSTLAVQEIEPAVDPGRC